MSSNETNEVGQGVFGYSNGHRLLTSTVSLSSVDIYELAAASDLAPGAQISGTSSYLTGFSLPDSKLYALIRTWLAPEMPRPGCVWSHVLLLDQTLMATQIDLTVLSDLHRRPDGYASDSTFSKPVTINRRLRGRRAGRQETEMVLSACYGDAQLDADQEERGSIEQAIFAAWSQQWPRLRRQFVFRSIATTSELKGQFIQFKRGSSPARGGGPAAWLNEAVEDATSESVTPLRRFLWRYGKDVQSEKETLPELVQLHIATRSKKGLYSVADRVLTRFPPGQAETLKRDVLGLSSDKLSQVPSVNAVDLMRLLSKHQDFGVGNEPGELSSVFSRVDQQHLIELMVVLMTSREQLGDMFDLVFDAILPIVDGEAVEDPKTPLDFALMAATRRADLLTPALIERFASDDLLDLWALELTPDQRSEIMLAIMQRPYVDAAGDVALSQLAQALQDAVHLSNRSGLHGSWSSFFPKHISAFVDEIATVSTGDDLAAATSLFGFPTEPERVVRAWFEAFKAKRSSMSNDNESRLLAYLLALSIKYGIENYQDVLLAISDRLRHRILRAELPSDAENRLSQCLPYDEARWDLNRRLLKMFRKAYKRGRAFDEVLDTLNLTDDEYAYATDQDPDNMVRRFWRAFNPWSYWD